MALELPTWNAGHDGTAIDCTSKVCEILCQCFSVCEQLSDLQDCSRQFFSAGRSIKHHTLLSMAFHVEMLSPSICPFGVTQVYKFKFRLSVTQTMGWNLKLALTCTGTVCQAIRQRRTWRLSNLVAKIQVCKHHFSPWSQIWLEDPRGPNPKNLLTYSPYNMIVSAWSHRMYHW